ncbi:relaxase/mobilization nuclease domain-containing protein [Kitasatospora sp. NPDC052868]|uniref:relaxase/mobilization nuclease domain-containing protein n=1 Tax=Kitasatospora sp. NPDC052868 TaxID=3364060 RepID=UPI0037C7153A
MIAKITKGKRASGAIRYDFGPGRRDEHQDARVLAGNVPGTPQQVARLIDHHTRPSGIKTPIWRCSLSLPDEDGVLTDERFAVIAQQYVERMGYGGCPWVVVRHGDDHVHITVSRVGWDRRVVDDHGDYLKSMPIVRALEKQHRLVDAGALSNRRNPQVSGQERAASVKRGAVEPERLQIRAAVAEAVAAAAGRGRPAFEAELRQHGVDYRANVASTGRMNGYSFSVPAWTDAEGAQVWVTASKTSKDYAWQKLGPVLEPKAVAPEATGPDLAALRLAEARERAVDQRAEVVRTLGTTPAGTVPDLVTALRTLRTTLDTREGTLATETATAMRLDGLVSGVGMGPRRGELHRRRIGLQAAVGHEAEADGHATAAGQHRQEAAAAREVEAESKAGTASRWPRKAKKAADTAATAAALAARAEAEAARLEGLAARALERAAEAAPDVRGRYDEALTALESGWQQAERAAIGEDSRNARIQQIDHQPPLQAARLAVAKARRGVEQLLAEQARRAALPPERLQLEDQVRADLAREVTARAARAGSTTARPSKKAVPKKAAPKKAGPGLGQQFPPHLRPGNDPRGRGGAPGR